MREVFWLSDEAWTVIAPLLPTNQPGAHRVDDRRIISGIIHVLKSGCRWQDCPPEYGPTTTVYNRFNRWLPEPLKVPPQAGLKVPPQAGGKFHPRPEESSTLTGGR